MEEIRFGNILNPYRGCFDGRKLCWLHNGIGTKIRPETWDELRSGTWNDFENLTNAFRAQFGYPKTYGKDLFNLYSSGMTAMLRDPITTHVPNLTQFTPAARKISEIIHNKPILWIIELIAGQERLITDEFDENRPNIHEECHLTKTLIRDLRSTDLYEISPNDQAELIQWLYFCMDDMKNWSVDTLEKDLNELLGKADTMRILKTNYFNHVTWFNAEAAETLVDLVRISGYYLKVFDPAGSAAEQIENTLLFDKAADMLAERIANAEYHYDRLLTADDTDEEAVEASESDQDL